MTYTEKTDRKKCLVLIVYGPIFLLCDLENSLDEEYIKAKYQEVSKY